MRIGLTYDLKSDYLAQGFTSEQVAEFDTIETIDAIDTTLVELGAHTTRIGNIRQLVAALAAGERWDLVFNIAEGLRGFAREAQVPALLDAYDIPYTFSDALTLSLALHKALAKRVVRDAGVATAAFVTIESPGDLGHVDLALPLFVKPVAEGTSKGIDGASLVHDSNALRDAVHRLFDRYQQPVLVEEYLPGREFTVGILGTGNHADVVGVMEVMHSERAQGAIYGFVNKASWDIAPTYRLIEGQLGDEVRRCALSAWKILGCRDGGRVDVRLDGAGRPNFIEANPLAGLRPGFSDFANLAELAGVPYRRLIARILASSFERLHNKSNQLRLDEALGNVRVG